MKKLLITLISTTIFASYIIGMEKTEFTQQQMVLTNELYHKELTPFTLIQLHQQGAVINGKIPKYKAPCGRLDCHDREPLSHWVVNFNYHYSTETPCTPNDCCTKKHSNLDGKKTIKDLEIIIQLLGLGAEPTKEFEEYYDNLLKYNINNGESKAKLTKKTHDKNLEILLKSKPTKIGKKQIKHIWKYTITPENHPYVDLLIAYFTPEELQPGLDYCIANHDDVLEKFGYSHEEYEKYIPGIMQKFIAKGATPNNQLSRIAGDVVNSWEHKMNLEILKCLYNNGAFDERTIDILERHLEDMEKEKIVILSAIERMKQNQSNAASSAKEQ